MSKDFYIQCIAEWLDERMYAGISEEVGSQDSYTFYDGREVTISKADINNIYDVFLRDEFAPSIEICVNKDSVESIVEKITKNFQDNDEY